MNLKQLEYAVRLSEAESFSQLAEKLGITQPALSKHILALEKEIGVPLFERGSSPISLTAAGEHFVRSAKDILYKEEELLRSMEKFKSGERGEIVIGITPFRSSYLVSDVVKEVQKKYSGVKVRLVEEGSDLLRKDVLDGRFDFAIVNLPLDEGQLDVTLIEPDRLAVVVPADMLDGDVPEGKASFKRFASLPYAVVGASQEMRVLFERLCAAADAVPNVAVEVVSLTTAFEMACSGVAATLLPIQFISSRGENPSVKVFELTDEAYMRQPAIAVKRGRYLPDAAKYAIELLTR
ncbi:MAG: LysR family transcriptional regulator [Clostridia bacterium]|nr:LysR family transcriptional regulator [Clostridia bacterium]